MALSQKESASNLEVKKEEKERSLDEWLEWINMRLETKLKSLKEGVMQENSDYFNQDQEKRDSQYGIIIADELNQKCHHRNKGLQVYPYQKLIRNNQRQ